MRRPTCVRCGIRIDADRGGIYYAPGATLIAGPPCLVCRTCNRALTVEFWAWVDAHSWRDWTCPCGRMLGDHGRRKAKEDNA